MAGLVILDRDGVLNAHTVDAEQGTIDSPLHPRQVRILDGVPEALAQLNRLGFGLAIASNQPAAAKGKTTYENLRAVHSAVVAGVETRGARILSSHLCFHRSEDCCACRKPRPGLLAEAFAQNPGFAQGSSWMVGDGVTDVQAGRALGLRTVFVATRRCDACAILKDEVPDYWGSLITFASWLASEAGAKV